MAKDFNYLLDYLPYATETQSKYIEEVASSGSIYRTAKNLGVDQRTVSKAIDRVKARAAKSGYAPDKGLNIPQPTGYSVTKTATMYRDPDPNSETPIKWVSNSPDKEAEYNAMREAAEAFRDELPKADLVPFNQSGSRSDDKLNLYILTDYHLGMYAWGEETGENWDINIAEKMLYRWIDYSVALAPDTETAIFAQLGDLLHWDGLDAVTPANRHVLDADTRFQLVVRVAIRAMRYIIKRLLEKHESVHVINADANHDPAGRCWMAEWLDAFYENEPRVTVDVSGGTYYAYKFGQTSLFFHHGHKKRINTIAPVFTRKFRDIYGSTKYSYGHIGHLHHYEVSEKNNLMRIEQHQTLAPKDAYAARGGFESDRSANVITYSSKYGRVSGIEITPEMIKD